MIMATCWTIGVLFGELSNLKKVGLFVSFGAKIARVNGKVRFMGQVYYELNRNLTGKS
tara:strand:+ start:264 stop:437 length:174 start_codon:yes stop_codon:yes gene_type:complete